MSLYYSDRGFRKTYTANENITKGDVCQICSNNKVHISDNTDPTTSQGNLLLALENITTDNEGTFLIWGIYDTTELTPGSLEYLGESGAFTETPPSGDCTIRIIGYNISATELFFNPNKTFVEMASSEACAVLGINTPSSGGSSSNPMIILTKSSSVNQNVGGANGTEVYWTWDGEDKKDTGFTHSTVTNSERVQVDADGWYQIRFVGNVQQTGSARTTLQGIIRVNGGTTERKGSIRDYTRGAGYGNLSPGLDCIKQLSNGDYIEIGTKVEDTDGVYTLSTNGAEIGDEENLLIVTKVA